MSLSVLGSAVIEEEEVQDCKGVKTESWVAVPVSFSVKNTRYKENNRCNVLLVIQNSGAQGISYQNHNLMLPHTP